MVRINGENLDIEGMCITDYLVSKKYDLERVAVEVNGEIVPRAGYGKTVFADGDVAEVVSFVGGG